MLKHTDPQTVRGRPTLKDGVCNERIFRNGTFCELKIGKEPNDVANVSKESNQKSNELPVNRKCGQSDRRAFADKDKVPRDETRGNDNKDATFPLGLNFRIPGHDCVTLKVCSSSPAVNKYLHMETNTSFYNPCAENKHNTHEYSSFYNPYAENKHIIHINIPHSIINVPKTGNPCHILFFQLRDCGTAGALVLYPLHPLLFLLKYFLAHFSFLISWLTSRLRHHGSTRLMSRNRGRVFWSCSLNSTSTCCPADDLRSSCFF